MGANNRIAIIGLYILGHRYVCVISIAIITIDIMAITYGPIKPINVIFIGPIILIVLMQISSYVTVISNI